MIRYIRNKNANKSSERYTYYFERVVRNIKSTHGYTKLVEGSAVLQGYELDIDDFDSYISSVWHLINQAKTDFKFPEDLKRRLLSGLTGCDIHSPSFLEAVDDLQHEMDFNPACAKKVSMYPEPDMNKLPRFDLPATSPLLLKSALKCSFHYPQFNQGFLRPCYTKHGRQSFNVAGRSHVAKKKQNMKMSANRVTPKENMAPELFLSTMALVRNLGVEKYSMAFEIYYDKLYQACMKDTSIGYIPVQFLEIIDGAVKNATGLKKKDIAPIAIDMFKDYVEAVQQWIDGEKKGPCPKIIITDVEMIKYEINWNHELLEDPLVTPEEMDDALEKVRLFYMASVFDYMLALVCYKPISEAMRYYESAIGVRVEAGGLQKIWEILGHVERRKDQQEIIDKWKKRGIDLTKMKYGQGDWSKYDQTLLAVVLLFVSLVMWPFYDLDKNSEISPEAARTLYLQFIVSNVQKIMYVFGQGLFEVFGCMFSGKFITSIGDTIYQMLLKDTYFRRLLMKYPDSELLRDIIEYKFNVFFFYGDDHLASWCSVMDELKLFLYTEDVSDDHCLLKDFITFCTDIFGMNHKQKEFKVFPNLYGERYFTMIDSVFVEELYRAQEGPTFLKNQVSKIFIRTSDQEEFVLIGELPYRDTRDLAAKLTMTVKSSANVKTACMGLMSIARLCSGNPEAYCMAKVLYDEIAPLAGEITWEDWDYYKSKVGENSMRRATRTGTFPSYDEIVLEQREGKDAVGFIPKDFLGRPAPRSSMYFDTGEGNDQCDFLDYTTKVYKNDKDMIDRLMDSFNYHMGYDLSKGTHEEGMEE